MTDPLLSVQHLKKWFPVRKGFFQRTVGHVKAVDDVSFDVPQRQTLAVVGESGCGKTTLVKTILRLYEPDGGRMLFDGRDLAAASGSELRHLRRDMQIVFQDPGASMNPRMTVRSIIEEGLVIHGVGTKRERQDRVEELLRKVGLDPAFRNRYPHQFSGGQRQRISIARALALSPRLLVLDEPISALDVSIQSQVVNLLNDLKRDLNLTYLFISHDLAMVEYLSDRVVVMYLGEIVESAPAADLYAKPLHPYTLSLLASAPRMDPDRRRAKLVLKDDVPSPINPPSGCRFHPRCPIAMDVCKTTKPELFQIGDALVRCHAVEQGIDTRAAIEKTTYKEHVPPAAAHAG